MSFPSTSSITSTAYIALAPMGEVGVPNRLRPLDLVYKPVPGLILNTELLSKAPEAQILADSWHWEYSPLRPHSRTPLAVNRWTKWK